MVPPGNVEHGVPCDEGVERSSGMDSPHVPVDKSGLGNRFACEINHASRCIKPGYAVSLFDEILCHGYTATAADIEDVCLLGDEWLQASQKTTFTEVGLRRLLSRSAPIGLRCDHRL